MDWKYFVGRKVYIILKNNRTYSGTVLEVDDELPPIVWIVLLDKYDKRVTFCTGEIKSLQEEE